MGYKVVILEGIVSKYGITRERIQQIEVKARAKCRKWCQQDGCRLEDLLGQGSL